MRKYHTPTAAMTFICLSGAQRIAHAIHHGFTHASQKRFLFISMVSMSILVFHQSNVELLPQKENFKGAEIRTAMKYIIQIEQNLQVT